MIAWTMGGAVALACMLAGAAIGYGAAYRRYVLPALDDLDAQLDYRPRHALPGPAVPCPVAAALPGGAPMADVSHETSAITGRIMTPPLPGEVIIPGMNGRPPTIWRYSPAPETTGQAPGYSDGGWTVTDAGLVPPPGAQALGMGMETLFTPLTWTNGK